jgi:hypothetical protein
MTEAQGGFGEHGRKTTHKERQAGNAEEQTRRPHDQARSARQEHNDRVIADIRARLQEQKKKTTILPDGTEVTHFPSDPEALAQHNAWLDSLSPQERKAHADDIHREWDKNVLRGGLSVPEFLARNPHIDPDLFTADGRYLPGMRFGWARYDLIKLGKFLSGIVDAFVKPEDKK